MANVENKAPENAAAETNGTGALQPAQKKTTASERFMNKVIAEFGGSVGEIALNNFQKRLAQNYFISLDAVLAAAEDKRLKKSEKYRDPVPVVWDNVNLSLLARSVVAKARIGLDPAQKNHVNMVPFKNNASGKYDIVFIDGYRGIELTAKKYGQAVPDAVIVELVYTNDHFKSVKKNLNNPVENFEFEIVDDFNRGDIKGGFYYHAFKTDPEKNKLVVMTLADILKRKPAYASVEFWGGEKDKWENGKKVGTEHVDGWFEKMCWKTLYRAAYGDITIDSQKIDADYLQVKQMESMFAEASVAVEIDEYANSEVIDVEYHVDPGTGEVMDPVDGDTLTNDTPGADPSPAVETVEQTTIDDAAPPPVKTTGKGAKANKDPY